MPVGFQPAWFASLRRSQIEEAKKHSTDTTFIFLYTVEIELLVDKLPGCYGTIGVPLSGGAFGDTKLVDLCCTRGDNGILVFDSFVSRTFLQTVLLKGFA